MLYIFIILRVHCAMKCTVVKLVVELKDSSLVKSKDLTTKEAKLLLETAGIIQLKTFVNDKLRLSQ